MARKITKPYEQVVENCVYFDPIKRIQIGYDEFQWILVRGSHYTYHGDLESLISSYLMDSTRHWPFLSSEHLRNDLKTVTEHVSKMFAELNSNHKAQAKELRAYRFEKSGRTIARKGK